MANKILKNDQVIVTTGQNKGKTGKVIGFRNFGKGVVIAGVNVRQKTIKKREQKDGNQEGGFRKIEMPVDISNIAVFNSETNKKDKVIFITNDQNKKIRCYKSSKKEINNIVKK